MPTKKGKSKPAKAKKTSNKLRRTGGVGKTKRAGASRTASASKRGGKKRAGGKLRRTEAGPVWIGSSPTPVNLPAEDPGSSKATTGGGSDRVRIL